MLLVKSGNRQKSGWTPQMEGWRPSTSEDDETSADGHCGVYGDADGCSWTDTTIKLGQTDLEHCAGTSTRKEVERTGKCKK